MIEYFIILILLIFLLLRIYVSKSLENYQNKIDLAFYTCFYGNNNNESFKIPALPSTKYKCYYYTNNKNLLQKIKKTKWIGIYDNQPISDDLIVSAFQSKKIKAMPNKYKHLKKHNYLCYLDSKLKQLNESFIENCIDEYFINNNYAFLVRKHEFIKGSVWNEYKESMKQSRYVTEKSKYINYIKNQINNGLKETTSFHCQTGLIIRNMNHPDINNINKTWYNHICNCGIQCQISFYFVKQLFKSIYAFDNYPFL